MCAISGWVDFNKSEEGHIDRVLDMSGSMKKRGPDDSGVFVGESVVLAHNRLKVIDPLSGKQPMTLQGRGDKFTLVYNGVVYNTVELKKELKSLGHFFMGNSDTEVLLRAFIEWDIDCLTRLNGIFAFGVWQHGIKKLTLVRDRIGVKPLFFSRTDSGLLFASEIKGILASGEVKPRVDTEGLKSLLLLSPARAIGNGVFKDIEELRPAECLSFDRTGIKKHFYWKLEAKKHTQTLEQTIDYTRNLVIDSIERQMITDMPLATFLSGGLDSSIISYVVAKKFAEENKTLTTISVDYEDNSKFFKSNSFQPTTDDVYIKIMSDYIKSKHKSVVLDTMDVASSLNEAMHARDLPAMADIDSSLLLFCKEVKKDFTVVMSGECADELFGGYPWYHNKDILFEEGFPWARSLTLRKNLIKIPEIKNLADDWVHEHYLKTVKSTDFLDDDSKEEKRMREMFKLNNDWFMQCLIDRKDRMTMNNGLEARVPFCDYRIVEYAYNMPWKYKSLDGREKGILREAFSDLLPTEIVKRKKSPFPKTYNPIYLEFVRKGIEEILRDKNSVIGQLLDTEYLKKLMYTTEEIEPFFGQLMRLPQMLGFLIQTEMFFRDYKVSLV